MKDKLCPTCAECKAPVRIGDGDVYQNKTTKEYIHKRCFIEHNNGLLHDGGVARRKAI